MATSEVAIANLALQKLGVSKRLESLTQDHPNARTMSLAYEPTRDAELRRYTWGFSIARASIAADGAQTVWGAWNRYSLPNDFLRLIRDNETLQAVDWRIEGLFIITKDASPLKIRYVSKVTDPNSFDPLFREALACKLALQTCKEVTGSDSAKDRVTKEYVFAIAQARQTSAIEKEAQEFPIDEWLNARL